MKVIRAAAPNQGRLGNNSSHVDMMPELPPRNTGKRVGIVQLPLANVATWTLCDQRRRAVENAVSGRCIVLREKQSPDGDATQADVH